MANFFQGPPYTYHSGGGGGWQKVSTRPDQASAHPVRQPDQGPPLMHALQHRGGPLGKILQGPLDTHNPGRGSLAKFLAQSPAPVRSHLGHQSCQAPPISHVLQPRGVPLVNVLQVPLYTHNPGGEPLAKFLLPHDPTRAHPGHPPHQDSPLWHASQQRGGPLANFSLHPLPPVGAPLLEGRFHAPSQGAGIAADL